MAKFIRLTEKKLGKMLINIDNIASISVTPSSDPPKTSIVMTNDSIYETYELFEKIVAEIGNEATVF